jgi:putative ABC transport system permease protein
MKNFHYRNIREKIQPLVFTLNSSFIYYVTIRLQGGDIPATMNRIQSTWEEINPLHPFEHRFFDEDFESMYQTDKRMKTVLNYASFVAILIACIGLFGLALFMAEKRTKEMGLRKALGASVPGLVVLLSGEFIRWIVAANVIAWPVAYVLMNRWLGDFAYRIQLGVGIFLLSGVLVLVISFMTVAAQSIRVAGKNPVESLKYE